MFKYCSSKVILNLIIKNKLVNKNFSQGVRDNFVMKLCFGNKNDPDFFLGNNNFDQLSSRLYGPLIQALRK